MPNTPAAFNAEQDFLNYLKTIDNTVASAEQDLLEYLKISMREGYASFEEYRAWAKKAPHFFGETQALVDNVLAVLAKDIGAQASLKKEAIYDSFYVQVGEAVEGPYTREQLMEKFPENYNSLLVSPVGVEPTTWDNLITFATSQYTPQQAEPQPVFAAGDLKNAVEKKAKFYGGFEKDKPVKVELF